MANRFLGRISILIQRVRHIGPLNAKIAIVGMAPGHDEVKLGVPFIGVSGTLLSTCMRQVGINRGDCFITNVSEVMPPNNNLDLLKSIGIPLDVEVARLKDELLRVKPRVIIALGGDATYHLTGRAGKSGIYNWRGSILPCILMDNTWVIPSLHPAGILRGEYKHSAFLMFDLLKAAEVASVPNYKPKHRILSTDPSFHQIMGFLEDIIDYKNKISLDLETNRMDKDGGLTYIRCVGIATSETYAMCIIIHTKDGSRWHVKEEVEIWKLLHIIFSNKKIIKIVMNQSFELSVLYNWVGEITPIRDIAISHHLMQPETPKKLKFTNSIYTDIPFYKDDAKEANFEDEATWLYNCKDCVSTYEVDSKTEAELKAVGMWDFYIDYQLPLARILWIAMMTGIKVDTKRVLEYRTEYEGKLDTAQKELDKLVGRPLNVLSNPAMKWLLYEKLALPPQYHKKTREITTDEDAIEKLSRLFPSKVFSLVLEVRGYRKLLSTYLKDFWDSDDRCRCDMRVWGTVTGRLAATENVRGTGTNMQNQPEEIRDIYIADEGCWLLRVDLSQVESRLVAYLAQDSAMMKCFEDERDIHKLVGSMVYGTPYDTLTKDSIERDRGKHLGHAANYKVGSNTFAAVAKIQVAQAKALLNKYFTMFRLGEWHQEVKDRLNKSRTMTTAFGRRRTFYDRWGDKLFRDAIANEPQSTACDHINLALVRMYPKLKEGMTFLLQIHDELVFNVRKELLHPLVKIIREELAVPIRIRGRDIVIPITIEYGEDWKHVKSYE